MNDPLLVRSFKRLGDLFGDGQCFVEWNRAARNALRQILAFDEFHHQCSFFEPVDRRDVWMVQRRQRLRFALEAHHAIGVGGK